MRLLHPVRGENDHASKEQQQHILVFLLSESVGSSHVLPLAQVYRQDAAGWTLTGRLDFSDVVYRRAWSMAVYQGRLYCGTLPSGHVHAIEAGVAVSHDAELEPGWRHVVAMRFGNRLSLFVDGKRLAESARLDPARFDLAASAPLRIGFGEHDFFRGRLREVRLYGRALNDREVQRLFRASLRLWRHAGTVQKPRWVRGIEKWCV